MKKNNIRILAVLLYFGCLPACASTPEPVFQTTGSFLELVANENIVSSLMTPGKPVAVRIQLPTQATCQPIDSPSRVYSVIDEVDLVLSQNDQVVEFTTVEEQFSFLYIFLCVRPDSSLSRAVKAIEEFDERVENSRSFDDIRSAASFLRSRTDAFHIEHRFLSGGSEEFEKRSETPTLLEEGRHVVRLPINESIDFELVPHLSDRDCKLHFEIESPEKAGVELIGKRGFRIRAGSTPAEAEITISETCASREFAYQLNVGTTLPSEAHSLIVERDISRPDRSGYPYTTVAVNEYHPVSDDVGRRPKQVEVAGSWVRLDDESEFVARFTASCSSANGERCIASDVEKVSIFANVLEVATSLNLASSDIDVYAETVIFSDQHGRPANLIATPIPQYDLRSRGTDEKRNLELHGTAGGQGRAIRLLARQIEAYPAQVKRFIADGGAGQSSGAGIPGRQGRDAPGGAALTAPDLDSDQWCDLTDDEYADIEIIPRGKIPPFYGDSQHSCLSGIAAFPTEETKKFFQQHQVALRPSRGWKACQAWKEPKRSSVISIKQWQSEYQGQKSYWGIYEWGSTIRPENGCPGAPAPVPGVGGNGGALFTNMPIVAELSSTAPGPSGSPGLAAEGGLPGAPQEFQVYLLPEARGIPTRPGSEPRELDVRGGRWEQFHSGGSYTVESISTDLMRMGFTEHGKTTPPPTTSEYGKPGNKEIVDDPHAWIHPKWLGPTLQYLEDQFRSGDRSYVYSEATRLLAHLESLKENRDGCNVCNETPYYWIGVDDAERRLLSLVSAFEIGLDFYGNPLGWVPTLSFEATLALHNSRIRSTIPLYATLLLLDDVGTEREQAAQVAEIAVQQSIDLIADDVTIANTQSLQLGELVSESEELGRQWVQAKSDFLERLEQLKDIAEDEIEREFWRESLKMAGEFYSSMPIPQMAYAGQWMSFIGKFGEAPIEEVIGDGKTLYDSYKKLAANDGEVHSLRASLSKLQELSRAYDEADNDEARSTIRKDQLKELGSTALSVTELLVAMKSAADRFTPRENEPDGKFEEALARLMADDRIYLMLEEDILRIEEERLELDANIAKAIYEFSSALKRIESNRSLAATLLEAREKNLVGVDFFRYLSSQGYIHRLEDGIAKSFYYIEKAFEYRFLVSALAAGLPTHQEITAIVNGIRTQIKVCREDSVADEIESCARLAQEDLFRPYNLSIQAIGAWIEEYAQEHSNRFSTEQRGFSLSPAEILALNSNGQVTVDLSLSAVSSILDGTAWVKDIEVENLQVSNWLDGAELVELDIRVGPTSHMLVGDKFLSFVHPSNSYLWGARCERKLGSESCLLRQRDRSPFLADVISIISGSDVLVNSLLANPSTNVEITIRASGNVRIGDLALVATVEFDRPTAPNRHALLKIRNIPGHEVPLTVSEADLTGRSTGVGSFARYYRTGTQVTLEAPEQYNGLRFSSWSDGAKSRTRTITMDTARCLSPLYGQTNQHNSMCAVAAQ